MLTNVKVIAALYIAVQTICVEAQNTSATATPPDSTRALLPV